MFTDLYIHNIPFYIYIVNTLLIIHSFFHKKKTASIQFSIKRIGII